VSKFSIILPVRNGGEYLKECVNSILRQRRNDFNLIILDNCSTDGTTQWVRTLNDPRIVLMESPAPLTIEQSWHRIVTVPKNDFISLIGHDDILHENYLTVMDSLISRFPEASLYQCHFNYIDEKGRPVRDCKPMMEKETGSDFLKSVLTNSIDIMGTGFMMRSRDYDALGGIPDYPNLLFADFELWFRLTAKSVKITSPEQGFSFRIHQSTTSSSPDIKMQTAFDRFISYLVRIKDEDEACKRVILQNGVQFISFYCKGLSHRLLRTPRSKRGNLTVRSFTEKCKHYADLLVPGNNYNPTDVWSVWVAVILDSNPLGRFLFELFKKVYSKPLLK
jgi:glycosyltransferase involved in cell wall biosynthesis